MDTELESIQARIEHSRRDLSETIEALVYKADVPARASDAISDGIATAKETVAIAFNEAAEHVPMSTRRKIAYGVSAIVAFAILASLFRRGRSKPEPSAEVDELLLFDAEDLKSLPLN